MTWKHEVPPHGTFLPAFEQSFFGYRLTLIPDQLEPARRTWGERLFTRPWRPWRRHKMVPRKDQSIYLVDRDHMLVPQSVLPQIEEAIKKQDLRTGTDALHRIVPPAESGTDRFELQPLLLDLMAELDFRRMTRGVLRFFSIADPEPNTVIRPFSFDFQPSVLSPPSAFVLTGDDDDSWHHVWTAYRADRTSARGTLRRYMENRL